MDDLGVSAFQETTLGGSPGVMPRGYDTTNLGQGSGVNNCVQLRHESKPGEIWALGL